MNAEDRLDRDRPAQATRRIAKNTAYLAVADTLCKALGFVFYLLAARRLGAEKFGVLSFAIDFVTMFAVLTDLGLGVVSAREIARNRSAAQWYVRHVMTMKLLASAFVILLIGALATALGYPWATIRVVFLCSLSVVGTATLSYYAWVFQGLERMELAALARVAQMAGLVLGGVLVARGAVAVERYVVVYSGAALAAASLSVVLAAVHLIRPGLTFAPREWWGLLRMALPMGMTVVFTMFYYWNGTTLLSRLANYQAAGAFSAAFRLAMGLAFIGFAFSGGVFPLFSRLVASDPVLSSRALELSLRYMAMLMLPVAAFVSVSAPALIVLLYGNGYDAAIPLLRILGFWALFACLNSLWSNFLISADRPGLVTLQTGLALTVNLPLNLLLIPVIGARAVAVSLLAAEAASCVLLATLQLRAPTHARVGRLFKKAPPVLGALVVAVLVAAILARGSMPVALGGGLLVYLLLLIAMGGVGRADWQVLRYVLRSSNA